MGAGVRVGAGIKAGLVIEGEAVWDQEERGGGD